MNYSHGPSLVCRNPWNHRTNGAERDLMHRPIANNPDECCRGCLAVDRLSFDETHCGRGPFKAKCLGANSYDQAANTSSSSSCRQ
jgi:hypothetical protein